jgi:hypothetical protein
MKQGKRAALPPGGNGASPHEKYGASIDVAQLTRKRK